MAASHTFRTAMRGFNREDVVRYIEYLNNQHNAQLAQLRAQSHQADPELQSRLEAAQNRCAELEAQLAALQENRQSQPQTPVGAYAEELEAYRRAERTEREAKERAQAVCTQAQALLDEATLKAEAAREQFEAVCQQLEQYQASTAQTRQALQETVNALHLLNQER